MHLNCHSSHDEETHYHSESKLNVRVLNCYRKYHEISCVDKNDVLQLTVQAEDGRGSTAQATVDIIIIRNPDDRLPVWQQTETDGTYSAQIRFDIANGSVVSRRVRAVDSDLQVIDSLLPMTFFV